MSTGVSRYVVSNEQYFVNIVKERPHGLVTTTYVVLNVCTFFHRTHLSCWINLIEYVQWLSF